MNGNNNFLLKIHMEDEENTTEIYLNKERRSFTFINDECISDLIIPEFKMTSLNMILQNISDDKGDDNFYAEFEKDNELVREYDKEKITILSNMITKISINDFLDYQKDIKINEYYVDNIVDAYDCVLPNEIKKIVSYTTNGVVFNGEEIIYFLPHEDIVSYDGPIKNFIPLMIRNGKNYIGYDFKESIYKEYEDEKVVKEAKKIDDLIEVIDLISVDEEISEKQELEAINQEKEAYDIEMIGEVEDNEEEKVIGDEKEEEEVDLIGEEISLEDEKEDLLNSNEELDIEKELEKLTVKAEDIETQIARIDEEYENTIKNIDYQFEKLNNVLIKKEEKEEYKFKEKEIKEEPKEIVEPEKPIVDKVSIEDEIRAGVRKSLEEIENTNEIIDEIDKDIEKVVEKAKNIKAKKDKTEKDEKIGKEAIDILEKINAEIANLEKAKEINNKRRKSEQINKEAEDILQKLNNELAQIAKDKEERVEKQRKHQINREAEQILEKLNTELEQISATKKKNEETKKKAQINKEAENILQKLNVELAGLEKAKVQVKETKKKETKKEDKTEIISKQAEAVLAKINAELLEIEKIRNDKKAEKITKEAESILQKLNKELEEIEGIKAQQDKVKKYKEISKEAEDILTKLNGDIKLIEKEKRKIERAKEKEKKEKAERKDIISLETLINNSINNAINNYQINFNDTQKLVVEHLPYYEFSDDFNVIQIPEIEIEVLPLLPEGEIDLGRLKLEVVEYDAEKVKFYVQNASFLSDGNDNRVKKGDYLTLKINNEINLRLNKKNTMESWSIKMEKSTFERELRNIDFHKIMNKIVELESFKKLGNIEKYELNKSIMLFINFVMQNKEYKVLEKLYSILEKNPKLYEEHITKYNIENSLKLKNSLNSYEDKKGYYTKLNYVNGLIDAKWLDYPRYIFNSHNYFYQDEFMTEFIEEVDELLDENDFYNYLMNLFSEYEMFNNLDEEGKENLDRCIEYLSVLYKYRPDIGEDNKYKIERTFMIGATEEEMALLISKLCRRGIKDYSIFTEYDAVMKEKFVLGTLKYPIYSEYFELDEIRNGGGFDEFEG